MVKKAARFDRAVEAAVNFNANLISIVEKKSITMNAIIFHYI